MDIRLSSSPAEIVAGDMLRVSITQDLIPGKVVSVANMAEAIKARDEYVAECAATGKPGAVSVYHWKRSGGRKLPGFDREVSGFKTVNL